MFHHLHDREPDPCPSGALDRWAREEAKSAAMVDDVLAGRGAVAKESPNNSFARWLRLAVLTLLGVVSLVLFMALVVFTAPPPRAPTDGDVQRLATGGGRQSSTDELPRFWGPFRP